MNPNAAPAPALHREGRWLRFALRGVKTSGAAVLIAICLWAILRDPFEIALVYSMCISLTIWLLIDLGRDVAASIANARIPDRSSVPGRWPSRAWMVAIVGFGAILGYAGGNEIANWITGLNLPGPFNASLRQTLALLVMALVPAMVITYYFQSREIIATQKSDVETAQRQAAEQQLKLLESQLEPHMLFNTLANLRALIGVDPARAQAMLDQLIAFLRASLTGSRLRFHPVAAEFERVRDYLALMQIRMGPRLETRFVLPAELGGALVPPLLLQPLVENSIKHGLEPHVAGGRIDVSAAREGESLVLRVRDNGAGLGDAGGVDASRYGLAHVRERLATLYGERASFELGAARDADGGTLATIRLPLQTAADAAAAT
jgi:hypothetical protein